jgi:hypothetical protein
MAEDAKFVRQRAVKQFWERSVNADGFRGYISATNPTMASSDVGKVMNRINSGIYSQQDCIDVLNGVKSL